MEVETGRSPMSTPYSFHTDPTVPDFDDGLPLAVMDGDCAICSWGARLIHRLDRSGTVRITPAQSPLGAALLRHYGLTPEDPASWLFIHQGVAHVDLEAVIYAGQLFGGPARLVGILRLLPKPARSWLYRRVARNRHALFGRADLCSLPDPGLQKRLLR